MLILDIHVLPNPLPSPISLPFLVLFDGIK